MMTIQTIQPSLVRSVSPFEHLGIVARVQEPPKQVRTAFQGPQYDWQTINPQPLPPKQLQMLLNVTRRLTPQPLPSKPVASALMYRARVR